MNREYTGEMIRRYRLRKNLTQRKLALVLGNDHHDIEEWERGLQSPSKEQLKTMAELFELSVEELTGAKQEKLDDEDTLDRINNFVFGLYRYGVLPIMLFILSISIAIFLLFNANWYFQLVGAGVITASLLLFMYNFRPRKRRKVIYIGLVVNFVLTFAILAFGNIVYAGYVSTLFTKEDSQPSSYTVDKQNAVRYVNDNGAFAVAYEWGDKEGTYYVFSLDKNLENLEQTYSLPNEEIIDIVEYNSNLYLVTVSWTVVDNVNTDPLTKLYMFNDTLETLDLILAEEGSFRVAGGTDAPNLIFYSDAFGSPNKSTRVLEDGELKNYKDLPYPIYSMVYNEGEYYVSIYEGEFSYIVQLDEEFNERKKFESVGSYFEIYQLSSQNDYVFAYCHDRTIVVSGSRIELEEDNHENITSLYTGDGYYYIGGKFYNDQFQLVAFTAYIDDFQYGIDPSFVYANTEGEYIGISESELVLLNVIESKPIVISRINREIMLFSSMFTIPFVLTLGIKKKEKE